MPKVLLAAVPLLLVSSPALAYDGEVHSFLVQAALGGAGLGEAAPPIPAEALVSIRAEIDRWARTSSDSALRAEWLARYPTPERFDAWAFKELLLFDPRADVFGIDRVPSSIPTLLDAVTVGAQQPDEDRRNRERIAFDLDRKPVVDARGGPVPADPAILNMGKLGALSSQAHAHYGLAELELSDDPEVLKAEPRRFAIRSGYSPGPVLTLAAEMAQQHLDLALIASLMSQPNPTLAWMLTGQAFHYVQDVTNQIHTVQVGIYDFFVDATLERYSLALKTGGGYFGELRTMPSIGIDILTNHHVISEQLVRRRLLDTLAGKVTSEGAKLVEAPKKDEAEFARALDEALGRPGADAGSFAGILTRATIEVSSREGGPVYSAVRSLTDPRFRQAGVLYSEKSDDPDSALAKKLDQSAYDALFALGQRAFQRAGTVMRAWVRVEKEQMGVPAESRAQALDVVIERLVRRQLRLLGEAESRRTEFLGSPQAKSAGPERMPIALAVESAVVGGAAWLVLRRLRRKRASTDHVTGRS